jgi:hypothetical protein
VNIYRNDDESTEPVDFKMDMIGILPELDNDPEKREQIIGQIFGNYIVTLGKLNGFIEHCQ